MAKDLGINLGAAWLNYDCSSLVFADLMKMAGTWNGFGSNPNPGYTADNWPNYVDGTTGPTTVVVALNAYLPAGAYTLYPTGVGSIRISGNFQGCDSNGNLAISFNGSNAPVTVTLTSPGVRPFRQISFTITSSQSGNPLKLKFLLPGHAPTRLLNQAWIDTLKPASGGQVKGIRFMDAQKTNAQWVAGNVATTDGISNIDDWTNPNRARPGFSFYKKGRMPEEYIVGMINEIKAYGGINVAPWVHTPVKATFAGANNWGQGFAGICRDGCTIDGYTFGPLNPAVPIYHEYSNETWNTGFGQWLQHQNLRTAEASTIAAWRTRNSYTGAFGDTEYYAHRKSYAARKFKAAFAGDGRTIISAWMGQGGYPGLSIKDLTHFELPNLYDDQTYTPDMIGAGLYTIPETASFTYLNIPQLSQGYAANPSGTLNTYFACYPQFFADFLPLLQPFMDWATAREVPFGIYEFGDNLNVFGVNTNTYPNAVAMCQAIMRDPRMGPTVYDPMMDAFPEGSLACLYFDASWVANFFWGIDEHTGQTPQSPRRISFNAHLAGGTTPETRVARRWPRGTKRRRATGQPA